MTMNKPRCSSLPPVIEYTATSTPEKQKDDYNDANDDDVSSTTEEGSTVDSTLVPSSSFSNETSPLRHRGRGEAGGVSNGQQEHATATATFWEELPGWFQGQEPNHQRQQLQTPANLEDGACHPKKKQIRRAKFLMNLVWTLLIVMAVWNMSCDTILLALESSLELSNHRLLLQVGTNLPSEMNRQLFTAKILQHPPSANAFTIVLKGSHLSRLRSAVKRFQDCPGVHEIQLDWIGGDGDHHHQPTAPHLNFFESTKVVYSGKKKPLKSVLLLDESVILSCNDIARAFLEWKKDPVRAVGFLPLLLDDNGNYSLLSDRALFVHRSYLSPPFAGFSAPSSSVVHHHACQEWVLSGKISAVSHKHPLAMMQNAPGMMPLLSYYSSNSNNNNDNNLEEDVLSCQSLIAERLSLSSSSLPVTRTIYTGDHGLQR